MTFASMLVGAAVALALIELWLTKGDQRDPRP